MRGGRYEDDGGRKGGGGGWSYRGRGRRTRSGGGEEKKRTTTTKTKGVREDGFGWKLPLPRLTRCGPPAKYWKANDREHLKLKACFARVKIAHPHPLIMGQRSRTVAG
ncbi:hypothetical protein IE53DRAFT_118328 [Violaceomyces palustris]|uniref:Uncharacterized protein n=1 Tax=Violaceomyces palustris TaxID=1673888 RepID=A0ACD0NVW9_9BASI|nr:hypothetical protein IE53DRAFT_118328 [Violaceomyces palustris]